VGCGSGGNGSSIDEILNDNYSNVKISNNGKNIFITSSSVVGLDNYILGTLSKKYDSIITVANPYKITYVNCFLEENGSDYLLYSCDSFQDYCDDVFECVQVYIDKNKDMYISKQNSTYLYQQGTSQDNKYALGEFKYLDGNLSFEDYKELKELK
jgi:hypothetical protein